MLRIALFLLLALPLAAQRSPDYFPWWDSPLAKDLNLSEDQNRQIRSVIKEFRSRLVDCRAAVEKAEIEVQDDFNEEIVDQRRTSEAIDRLIAARGELTRAFSQMSLRLRVILTADQWRELQKRRPRAEPGQLMREFQRRREGGPPRKQLPQQPQPPQPPRDEIR